MRKVFTNTGEAFSAINEAREWLGKNGFSVGSMEGRCPIGVHRGDAYISKWTRMSLEEQRKLDGMLESHDFRDGDVVLTVNDGGVS